MSVLPPAASGTTTVTGRVGQSSAWALPASSMDAKEARRKRRVVMMRPSFEEYAT